MADKHFFDLLKDKMAELRPSEQHRDNDWAALGDRLNNALPEKPGGRRQAILLPLLLLSALLSTNAVWWQSNHKDRATMAKLEIKVADLQAKIAATGVLPRETVRTDTVWRTVYVQQIEKTKNSVQATEKQSEPTLPIVQTSTEGVAATGGSDSITKVAGLSNLELAQMALLELPEHQISSPKPLGANPLKDKRKTEPFGQNLLKALRPRFFKVGASAGWLNANSSALMHEGGFTYNLRGQIGLSRHWGITMDYGMGSIHYKSHIPEAILGAPTLPVLPSMEHHFAEMDVTGQKIRQFNLSLRYTFAQPGKPRPFLALGWGGQTLLPFTIEYEIQHEPTGAIQKEVFEVTSWTKLRNILGMNAGVEVPFSPRFNLNLEGFYQRQWKKSNSKAPDLTGIRAGLTWQF